MNVNLAIINKVSEFSKIEKIDDTWHYVEAPVLQPDVKDYQDDIINADEVQKAAHGWIDYQGFDYMHEDDISDTGDVRLAETWVEKDNDGIPVGDWRLGTLVKGRLWEDIQAGKINGYSINGRGKRKEIGDNVNELFDVTVEKIGFVDSPAVPESVWSIVKRKGDNMSSEKQQSMTDAVNVIAKAANVSTTNVQEALEGLLKATDTCPECGYEVEHKADESSTECPECGAKMEDSSAKASPKDKVKEALEVLDDIRDELPEKVQSAIGELADYVGYGYPEAKTKTLPEEVQAAIDMLIEYAKSGCYEEEEDEDKASTEQDKATEKDDSTEKDEQLESTIIELTAQYEKLLEMYEADNLEYEKLQAFHDEYKELVNDLDI